MYSENKADKLIKEFSYLIGMSYYPFGQMGRAFKIEKLEKNNVDTPQSDFINEAIKAAGFGSSNYYELHVLISDGTDMFTLTLIETLQALNIRHDIDKIPD